MENRAAHNESITQQLAGLSPAKRALLELRLMKKRPAGTSKRMIPRRTSLEPAPLSYNQQGLWVLNQLMPGTSLYHTPMAVRLTGSLDASALKQALNSIVARHDALRTTFTTLDGTPSQFVAPEVTLALPLFDLSNTADADREADAQKLLQHEARKPFDLSQGPLVRALLVRLAEHEHILLVTMHHIVTDGWSLGIFQRELSAFYQAAITGEAAKLPDLAIQYPDYSSWQRRWFAGELYESQLSYWKKQFDPLPRGLELPADHLRQKVSAHRAYRGDHHTLRLPKQLTTDLKNLSQKQGVTLFMTLLAAYEVLLQRYSGEDDIVVGTPMAGRQMPETEHLIGLFINTLPLRTSLAGDPSFNEVLGRVKESALGAFAHQDLPFERMVKELHPERSLSRNPLFQVMFVLQSAEILPLEFPGLVAEHFRVGNTMANFDLTLDVVERDGELVCLFESNADLFEAETIVRLMGHFQTLLEGALANPEGVISSLPMLTEAERQQLLVEWNDTTTDYPNQSSIQELFEQQVRDTPDAVALVCVDRQVTYRELNSRANQLAHYLRKRGVAPDTCVGLCLQRSVEMITVLLGILKAGGAYLPLDPEYPQARLEFMVKDAQVPVLITERGLAKNLPLNAAEVIYLEELRAKIDLESTDDPEVQTSADNLAYVIYTSGSTGHPKGVAVTHRNVVRLVKNTNYASFAADEVFLQSATISFDASTFEIWGSLLNGARLALMPAGCTSLRELAAATKRFQVTTLWLTAGLFHLMVDNHLEDLQGVRQLLAGGDVLSVPHVQQVLAELKGCRLINGYGPTESTTFTCCHTITDPGVGSVPIGRPISNTSVYILDRAMNPVPVGIAGELYVGGDGVARGYLNRPELNAERFVSDPFAKSVDARLYRTGDLVRYRKNGEIEFLGRIDNQVKVRGFRVELGEIESALAEHPAVREAVVVARKDSGDKHLAGYLVLSNGVKPSIDEIRQYLSEKLPEHMVPSVLVVLESLPLSPTGKVDRLALPPPNDLRPATLRGFASAADALELKLTRIWERVLGVHSISVNDNFFELGGHSLLAVRLFAQIEKSFGRDLPLATLFQAPTIKQLARVLREEGWPAPWSSLVVIQGGKRRMPLFLIHAAGGNVLEYYDLARLLGPDHPVYGLQAKGLDGREEPHTSIKAMAAAYLKEMREVQPEGPYLLGGRSSGGTVAFEMACMLAAEGQEVALLALLDTYPAGYFKLLPGSGSLGQRARRYGRKLNSHAMNLRELSLAKQLTYLFGKLKYAPEKTRHKLYRRAYKIYQQFGRPLPAALKNIEEINFAAVKDYVPGTFTGDATLFLATDLTADYDLRDGWRELVAGRIEAHEITGDHINIIKEPHVGVLAEKLRGCLDRAQGTHARARRAA